MTGNELIAFYEQRANNFESAATTVQKKIRLIANLRIATALLFLAIVYFGLTTATALLYILPLLVIIFVMLVSRHAKLFNQHVFLTNLLLIQKNEVEGLRGNTSVFDAGEEFTDPHHYYSHDLDLFGQGSLFQYVNRSKNISGKTEFAKKLLRPLSSKDEIIQHQQAVRELTGMTDFRHQFLAHEKEIQELPADKQQLREWVTHNTILYGKKIYSTLLVLLPVVTVLALTLSIFVDGIFPFFLFLCFVQWMLLGFHVKKINEFHQYISNKRNLIDKYARSLRCIRQQTFHSSMMKRIHAESLNADRELIALADLCGWFDARLNWMTSMFANSILLFDMQAVYRLERWKEKNAGHLERWLRSIHETESLISVANLSFNNTDYIFPDINPDRLLSGTSLGHPLISAEERVCNDITLDEEKSIIIITGANMAGKSTFLRTIGVNTVLALAGAPVCATAFTCPLIKLRTGMRTADSLQDHQSYFYAELNRLKSIVDELKSGEALFVLLDEILKGTNSTDKQAGSVALVRQLAEYPCLTIVATHDLVLGELENSYNGRIRNFRFEPSIENDQLTFDFKLKQGIATKMNATFLMRKMGIIPR